VYVLAANLIPMERTLIVEFTKMSGAGNDFIVLDNRFFAFSDDELSRLAIRLCHRREGIGADGLMALAFPTEVRADARLVYYNADGSRATLCGNGARCMARFARWAGVEAEPLTLQTDAGPLTAFVPPQESDPVRISMPVPAHFRNTDEVLRGTDYVWTGTEHLVRFVDRLEEAPVATLGPVLRGHPGFGDRGVNVNFVEVTEDGLKVRTWEKGVEGETLACATGAVAAVAVAAAQYRISRDKPVPVQAPGGMLVVTLPQSEGEPTWLEGPTRTVFRGTFEY